MGKGGNCSISARSFYDSSRARSSLVQYLSVSMHRKEAIIDGSLATLQNGNPSERCL
jgi:hypothetical protein